MKTALILPGGGLKGAIELGACKVILKKIIPDLIIGTSAGALNGAAFGNGDDLEENLRKIERVWLDYKKKTFFALNLELFYKMYHAQSIYSNERLYAVINTFLSVRKLEDLKIPLFINCTNLISGKSEFFSQGDILDPLVASCSHAPLLPPVYINKIPYADGSLGSVFGVEKALELNCKRVIIVNVQSSEPEVLQFRSFREHIEYSLALLHNQNVRNEIEICKDHKMKIIEIKPTTALTDVLSMRVSDMPKLIELGEKEAAKVFE